MQITEARRTARAARRVLWTGAMNIGGLIMVIVGALTAALGLLMIFVAWLATEFPDHLARLQSAARRRRAEVTQGLTGSEPEEGPLAKLIDLLGTIVLEWTPARYRFGITLLAVGAAIMGAGVYLGS
jgi:UPF0716 family protein affecting phage T7 exclusion